MGTCHSLSVMWSQRALVPASTVCLRVQPQALDLPCLPPSFLLFFLPTEAACLLLVFEHILGYPHTHLSHFCLNDESQTTDLTPNLPLPLPPTLPHWMGIAVFEWLTPISVCHLRSSLHDIPTFEHLLTHVSRFLYLHPSHLGGGSYHIIGPDSFRRRTWRYHLPSSTQWLLSAHLPSGEAHLCQQPSILLILLSINV